MKTQMLDAAGAPVAPGLRLSPQETAAREKEAERSLIIPTDLALAPSDTGSPPPEEVVEGIVLEEDKSPAEMASFAPHMVLMETASYHALPTPALGSTDSFQLPASLLAQTAPPASPPPPEPVATDEKTQVKPSGQFLAVPPHLAADRVQRGVLGMLGRFYLRVALGQGGFGKVYRAYDPLLDREVALKVPKSSPEDPGQVKRFIDEAKASARLHHPNIVTVFETGCVDKDYYIATEFVEGETLALRVRKKAPSLRQAVKWVRDVARALAYAHEEGIVHRDVKPANIMIDQRSRPRLMDFGMARRLDEMESLQPGMIAGTPAYMAPEQARGEVQNIGPATDQYSLGVVFYELLTRRRPFEGTVNEVLVKVMREQPRPPREVNPEVPKELDAICRKAMAPKTSQRYASLEEFAEELDRWLKGQPVQACKVSWWVRSGRWLRRRPALALMGSLSLLALVLATFLAIEYALLQAQTTRDLMEKQRFSENALAEAEQARTLAEQERRQARLALAKLYREQGIRLCDLGNPQQGVLFLGRALETAHTLGDAELSTNVRTNLAFFAGQILPQQAAVPLDQGLDKTGLCALTPDGKTLLRTNRSRCEFVDLASGKVRPDLVELPAPIQWVCCSPIGNQIFLMGNTDMGRLFDGETKQPIGPAVQPRTQFKNLHGSRVTACAYSPQGRLLVLALGNQIVRYQATTGLPLGEPLNTNAPVKAIAFEPDGEHFLAASDKQVQRWHAFNGQTVGTPWTSAEHITAIACHPRGKLAVVATIRTAQLRNLTTGQAIGPRYEHDEPLVAVAFSPDGAMLAAATWHAVRFWDMTHHRMIGPPLGNEHLLKQISFIGNKLLVADHATARVWNWTALLRPSRLVNHEDRIEDAVLSPDERWLCVRNERTARLWNTRTGELVNALPHEDTVNQPLFQALFSPDSRWLVTASRNRAWVWNAATGEQVGKTIPLAGRLRQIVFAPEGQRLLVLPETGTPQWYRLGNSEPEPWKSTPQVAREAMLSLDGRLLLTWDNNFPKEIRRYDAETGKALPSITAKDRFDLVKANPTGFLICTSTPKEGQLWNAVTGEPLGPARPELGGLELVEFSVDGMVMVTYRKNTLQWWNADTLEMVGPPLTIPESRLRGKPLLRISPDRNTLCFKLYHSVWVWQRNNGKPRAFVLDQGDDRQELTQIEFSPESRLLVTSSWSSIRLWDVSGSEPTGPLLHLGGETRHVGFGSGGRLLTVMVPQARLWQPPLWGCDQPADIARWVQLATGMELDAEGKPQHLSPMQWRSKWAEGQRRAGQP
jgi:WD40 repeat protein